MFEAASRSAICGRRRRSRKCGSIGGKDPRAARCGCCAPRRTRRPGRGCSTSTAMPSNIASRMNILHAEKLRALGLNVLAAEYRGYRRHGRRADGAGSRMRRAERLRLSARDQLRAEPQRIVDLRLVARVRGRGRPRVAGGRGGGDPRGRAGVDRRDRRSAAIRTFPIRLLIRNPFESIAEDRQARDRRCCSCTARRMRSFPSRKDGRLFDAAPQPKQFVEVSGGHVYASEKDPQFFPAVRAFLQAHRLLP